MKEMILCSVYKSSDNGETYLFVDYAQGLTAIPEALKETFSSPILVTSFKLHPEKKLARAKATVVMEAIDDQGFYLQLPPLKDAQLFEMASKNEKLPR